MSSTPKAAAIIIVLILLLAAGIVHMFSLRFEAGDIYPPYSSLRSDPLGTRGLHDSLQNLNNIDVIRNYHSIKKLKEQPPGTVLFSGIPSKWTILNEKQIAHDLKTLATLGYRVVVSFSIQGKWEPLPSEDDETGEDEGQDASEEINEQKADDSSKTDEQTLETKAPEDQPETQDPALNASEDEGAGEKNSSDPDLEIQEIKPIGVEPGEEVDTGEKEEIQAQNDQEAPEGTESSKEDDDEKDIDPRFKRIRDYLQLYDLESGKKNWGLTLKQKENEENYQGTAVLSLDAQDYGLAPSVQWYSTWYFDELSPDWKVIYSRDTQAVVVEKRLGKGSIVFASDSYFLSNEAMAADPYTEMLTWMIGPNTRILFDEWHLGIVRQDGIATLARKYGLASAGLALVFWALLYLWQNGAPLVPRTSVSPSVKNNGEHQSSRGYAEAMASLLRRNISPIETLRHCYLLWEGSMKNNSNITPDVRDKIRQAVLDPVSPGHEEIVNAYNRAVNILSRKR